MSNVDPTREQEEPEGLGGLVRRVLASGPSAEERLEQILAARRRELEETASRFDASLADLERREALLRDSRASVERMLRLGRKDLDAREHELTEFVRELSEREAELARAEQEIADRRQELGAVELKRAALERREREVSEREEHLSRAAPALAPERRAETVELAFLPGVAYRLVEVELRGAASGATVELEGEELVVGRIGPSPLPGDSRRCAYLLRPAG